MTAPSGRSTLIRRSLLLARSLVTARAADITWRGTLSPLCEFSIALLVTMRDCFLFPQPIRVTRRYLRRAITLSVL